MLDIMRQCFDQSIGLDDIDELMLSHDVYVLREQEHIVTIAMVEPGPIPLLWNVATHPRFQKQGLASALIAQVMTKYPKLGLFVDNPELLPFYERLGFCQRPPIARQPPNSIYLTTR